MNSEASRGKMTWRCAIFHDQQSVLDQQAARRCVCGLWSVGAKRTTAFNWFAPERTEDHSDLGHFPRLLTFYRRAGLCRPYYAFWASFPKLDQIALMKNCIALIQATEFEGTPGGLSVYDAISLGVRTIVSDIPVNREIEEWVTSYFPLNDIDALHHTMSQMMRSSPPSRDTGALRELGSRAAMALRAGAAGRRSPCYGVAVRKFCGLASCSYIVKRGIKMALGYYFFAQC